MLRPLSLLFAVIFLASSVSADIFIVEPIYQRVKPGETILLGSAEPGQTIELIISNSTGYGTGVDWHYAKLPKEGLPAAWSADDNPKPGKTFILKVSIPPYAQEAGYNFKVLMQSNDPAVKPEGFTARVNLKSSLLTASIQNLTQNVQVDKPAEYKVVLINNSVAYKTAALNTDLPASWYTPQQLSVEPRKTAEFPIKVFPRLSGIKNFTFTFVSKETGQSLQNTFNSTLYVSPTLKEKYSGSFYGFPFFTISLLPFEMVQSIVGALLPA